MVPDRIDLDYLRTKAAEYRRHAQAATGSHQAAWLLELAARYETRVSELETRHRVGARRRVVGHGRS
jgi:hypothetical protein